MVVSAGKKADLQGVGMLLSLREISMYGIDDELRLQMAAMRRTPIVEGGRRTRRRNGGRVRGIHKPWILSRKFHNCTEYTEHYINGINKTGHEGINNETN